MIQKLYQKLQTREGLYVVISLAIMVATVGAVLAGLGIINHGNNTIPSTITVSGMGEATVSPDIAKFTFSVSKDAATMAEARDQSAQVGNAVIADLEKMGIDKKDIKTEGFSAYPKYENKPVAQRVCTPTYCPPWESGNPVIVGYTVTTTYAVKVRNLDKASDVATVMTDAHVSSVTGPDFAVDDINAVQNQARALAIADARAQSKILARQLGVRLGKVVDFQVGNQGGYLPLYESMTAGGAAAVDKSVAPDLPAGETNVKVDVTITYRIR